MPACQSLLSRSTDCRYAPRSREPRFAGRYKSAGERRALKDNRGEPRRSQAPSPSPGTPGEGRGEGLIKIASFGHDLEMRVPRDNSRRLLNFARQMRSSSTDAEAKLWSILRSRSLAGFKFRRQHPICGSILDFYCGRRKLAVELDGGQHHDSDNAEYDSLRMQKLNEFGIQVLRFSDRDLLKDPQIVAEEIFRQLDDKKPSPRPSTGVPGEGE